MKVQFLQCFCSVFWWLLSRDKITDQFPLAQTFDMSPPLFLIPLYMEQSQKSTYCFQMSVRNLSVWPYYSRFPWKCEMWRFQIQIQHPKVPTKWSNQVQSIIFEISKNLSHFFNKVLAKNSQIFQNVTKRISDSDSAPESTY